MGKINEKIYKVLCEVYAAEIGAVGIYMDQHTKCTDMGYQKLADTLKADAVDEMKHAEALAERILMLGSTVKYQKHLLPEEKQLDIVAMLKLNINIEVEAIERLNDGITLCFHEKDHGSRMLLEEILKSEEKHLSDLQTKVNHIERFGNQYIVSHLI
ncbi:MAG: hypothetical protein F9K48_05145 [Candidatus Brocadia sp.]|nr:MAG: hypothetical protein F9K48_05145 [Candidatus Brocadia sp.]